MKNKVGVLFINNGRILICRDKFDKKYKLVGGDILKGETPKNAAIRTSAQALGQKTIIDPNLFKQLMNFDYFPLAGKEGENIYIYQYEGILHGKLEFREDIDNHIWYNSSLENEPLSPILKEKVIPHCRKKYIIK